MSNAKKSQRKTTHKKNVKSVSASKGFQVVKSSSKTACALSLPKDYKYSEKVQDSESSEEFEDPVMLAKFLDFLMQDVIDNPSKLVPYTEEMSLRARKLTAGVILDD